MAISLADRGKRVLLVSTDPASNLDEMLGVHLSTNPTPVPDVPKLSAMNIDPEAAAEAYRKRVIAPYEGRKSEEEIRTIREQLSGPARPRSPRSISLPGSSRRDWLTFER